MPSDSSLVLALAQSILVVLFLLPNNRRNQGSAREPNIDGLYLLPVSACLVVTEYLTEAVTQTP